jgi:hypothetical protein
LFVLQIPAVASDVRYKIKHEYMPSFSAPSSPSPRE